MPGENACYQHFLHFPQYFKMSWAPILLTKSVTKKQMNKCMAEIQGQGRIRTSDLMHEKPIP